MVYIIESMGFVKVGHAGNIQRRLDQIRSTCPGRIFILREYDAPDELEGRLQQAFAPHRHRGEWYYKFRGILRKADAIAATFGAVIHPDFDVEELEEPITPKEHRPRQGRVSKASELPEFQDVMRQLAKAGGRARAAKLSPERRSEIAKKAVAERERRRKLARGTK